MEIEKGKTNKKCSRPPLGTFRWLGMAEKQDSEEVYERKSQL